MLSNLIDRIKLHFRKDRELYSALYNILGFYPHNITYYKVALMHKSLGHRATAEEERQLEGVTSRDSKSNAKGKEDRYAAKAKRRSRDRDANTSRWGRNTRGRLGRQLNNERLEFLGDAILDAVVGDVVYRRFPGKPEGFLTNTRSKLVQRETLGRLAKEMGITNLILSSGRSATHNSYIGGNAFEALVGALYLDHGYAACQHFWERNIMGKYLDVNKVANKEVNFKSKILEWAQKNHVRMEFSLEDQAADKNGSPKFIYAVQLEGVAGEKGEGFSKKESQQKACELTLRRLRTDATFIDRIFAAKAERTRMEETPVAVAPDGDSNANDPFITPPPTPKDAARHLLEDTVSEAEREVDSLNLDDVTADGSTKSYEDIVNEAEDAAYALAAEEEETAPAEAEQEEEQA